MKQYEKIGTPNAQESIDGSPVIPTMFQQRAGTLDLHVKRMKTWPELGMSPVAVTLLWYHDGGQCRNIIGMAGNTSILCKSMDFYMDNFIMILFYATKLFVHKHFL